MSIRAAFFLFLFLGSGCSDGEPGPATTSNGAVENGVAQADDDEAYRTVPIPTTRIGTWYRAGAYRIRSRTPAVTIAPTPDLPIIPHDARDNPYCPGIEAPQTAAGKWARARGWRVSGEEALGPLTAVNVLRRPDNSLAGDCQAIDGRVVVFDREQPIASVATTSTDGYQISWSEPMASGALRLTANIVEAPFGDLSLNGHDLEVAPIPPADRVCNDRTSVPNIFAKPIQTARKTLAKAGWAPVPTRRTLPVIDDEGYGDIWSGADYRYHDGITEVTDCEPHGRCSFAYRTPGASIEVITQGDSVTAYAVTCASARKGLRIK